MDQEKEFKNVYLEFPNEPKKEKTEEEKKQELEEFREEENQRIISKTTRLSKEELQRRLEETQSLHL
jgi:uncharacterized damage-inducible protein DinB